MVMDPPSVAGETRTGTLVGFSLNGEPLVQLTTHSEHQEVPARSCIPLRKRDVGRTVVCVLERGETHLPIVIGLVQPLTTIESPEVEIDGGTVVLAGEQSVVLRCGSASISLERDGKIVIRGKHVVSHASGVNRIRGGSVELN